MKVIDYRIEKALYVRDLGDKVREAIKFGYEPQGGVSYADGQYVQAMVRYEAAQLSQYIGPG